LTRVPSGMAIPDNAAFRRLIRVRNGAFAVLAPATIDVYAAVAAWAFVIDSAPLLNGAIAVLTGGFLAFLALLAFTLVPIQHNSEGRWCPETSYDLAWQISLAYPIAFSIGILLMGLTPVQGLHPSTDRILSVIGTMVAMNAGMAIGFVVVLKDLKMWRRGMGRSFPVPLPEMVTIVGSAEPIGAKLVKTVRATGRLYSVRYRVPGGELELRRYDRGRRTFVQLSARDDWRTIAEAFERLALPSRESD